MTGAGEQVTMGRWDRWFFRSFSSLCSKMMRMMMMFYACYSTRFLCTERAFMSPFNVLYRTCVHISLFYRKHIHVIIIYSLMNVLSFVISPFFSTDAFHTWWPWLLVLAFFFPLFSLLLLLHAFCSCALVSFELSKKVHDFGPYVFCHRLSWHRLTFLVSLFAFVIVPHNHLHVLRKIRKTDLYSFG